jgi:ferredoxin
MEAGIQNLVKIEVEDLHGEIREIAIPDDMNLSLMEALKASEYPILATCGGMALCATCHVEIKEGGENLPEAQDAELDMIDTLPVITDNSRLACQLRIHQCMNGMKIRLAGDEI